MGQPKVILHWLNASRCNRILWVLELLEVDYELRIHYRKAYRSPVELFKLHPLGKAPIIEIVREGEENEVIAESGAILDILIDEFDHKGILKPSTGKGKREVTYWNYYSEATLQFLMTTFFLLDAVKHFAPWGLGFIVGFVTKKINDVYFGVETWKSLDFLEGVAAKNNGGYFVDGKLTGADISLSFPITEILFNGQRDHLFPKPPKEAYPNLYKWSQLIEKDSARVKSWDIILNNCKAEPFLK